MAKTEFQLPRGLEKAKPKVGLVLGSGLGGFVDSLSGTESFDSSCIGGFPVGSVPGHAGMLHIGSLSGVDVAIAQGRLHLYEGWSAKEVAAPIRLLHELGAETIVLTNAAGIVNANFQPGRWMLLSDHINLARQSPLTGSPQFIDQSSVYSRELRDLLKTEALEEKMKPLLEGVYAWVNGPEYETPSEIKMLRALGADAVGMSTVPEAIQACALGLRVVALSCLTNYGAGLSSHPLSHDEVMEVGAKAADELFAILEKAVPAMVEI